MNEGQAVLIGKGGQEIEGECGGALVGLIDDEVEEALKGEWEKQW